jgi:hypothetical protein
MLPGHLAYLEAEFAAAKAAPLSARKAMLCALLADAYADRLFAADPDAGDILVFREQLAARSPALQHVFDLAAGRLQLVTEAVQVPISEYHKLPIEDFMVSLYNDHSVQRVRIALPDGTRLPVHEVLAEAITFLKP